MRGFSLIFCLSILHDFFPLIKYVLFFKLGKVYKKNVFNKDVKYMHESML